MTELARSVAPKASQSPRIGLARGFRAATGFPWPVIAASDVFDLKYGRALVEADRRAGATPVFGTNGQCGWHDSALFNGPGVVLGRKGQGPLGVEWVASNYWVIDTAYSLQVLREDVDLKYSYYLIKYIGLNHLKDGTSNPSLSRDAFRAQAFPLAPFAEQRAIATLLGTLDDKIELNRRMNETLEEMARALFKSWFVDFDPVHAKAAGKKPYGMDEATASHFPAAFIHSDEGTIPRGWEFRSVRQQCEAVYDGPHATPAPAPSGPIFLGIANLKPLGLDLSSLRRLSEADWPKWTKRVVPREGDIVFSYEATLGYFALIPPDLRCCLGRRLALVRPLRAPGNQHYLLQYFVSAPFQEYLKRHLSVGATVDRILIAEFPEYPVLFPGDDLVAAFETRARPLWNTIHARSREAATLAALRDALLPKLLSGELRIKDAEKLVGEAT